MDKLTKEIILPYTPYDLNIEILNYKSDYVGIRRAKVNGHYFIGDNLYLRYEGGSTGKTNGEYKPILRPLSDLTKEVLSVYYTQLMDADLERCIRATIEYPLNQSYTFTQWLLKNHFDIHGLIKKNLAIDINTI